MSMPFQEMLYSKGLILSCINMLLGIVFHFELTDDKIVDIPIELLISLLNSISNGVPVDNPTL